MRTHSKGYLLTRRNSYQHRDVMEKYLGRKLRTDEHVHHIDGNKENNSIENLKIVSPMEHRRIHHGWKLDGKIWWKKCPLCKIFKEVKKHFYIRNSGKGSCGTYCKRCSPVVLKKWRNN